MPGSHDVSNAISYADGLFPGTDATAMAELYKRMLRPAAPRTKTTCRYVTDRIFYARGFGGVHGVFLTMWPGGVARS